MESAKPSGRANTLVLKGVLPPILYCLLLRVLTYSVILTEGVLLPTDWLYETFDPWKTLSPVGGERKPEAERCGYAALSARSLIRNSVCTASSKSCIWPTRLAALILAGP